MVTAGAFTVSVALVLSVAVQLPMLAVTVTAYVPAVEASNVSESSMEMPSLDQL